MNTLMRMNLSNGYVHLDTGGEIMDMDLKEFIHKNIIYSKCSEKVKNIIDTKLDSYEIKMNLLNQLTKSYDKLYEKYILLEKENKQLLDRIAMLESERWNGDL